MSGESKPPLPAPAELDSRPAIDMERWDLLVQLSARAPANAICELIDSFLATIARQTASIAQAIEARNHAALRAAAHALRGSSLNVGASPLARRCDELEGLAARSGDWSAIAAARLRLTTAAGDAQIAFTTERSRRAPAPPPDALIRPFSNHSASMRRSCKGETGLVR